MGFIYCQIDEDSSLPQNVSQWMINEHTILSVGVQSTYCWSFFGQYLRSEFRKTLNIQKTHEWHGTSYHPIIFLRFAPSISSKFYVKASRSVLAQYCDMLLESYRDENWDSANAKNWKLLLQLKPVNLQSWLLAMMIQQLQLWQLLSNPMRSRRVSVQSLSMRKMVVTPSIEKIIHPVTMHQNRKRYWSALK